MKCNLCGETASLRDNHTYRAHENAQGHPCVATGMHPDRALDKRRTFHGVGLATILRVINGADGIGVHARIVHDDVTSQIWVTMTPADARRMAAELIGIADLHNGRG